MGTNYYFVVNPCPHCGHQDKFHIGKSSAGWYFALHVGVEGAELVVLGIRVRCLADWERVWVSGKGRIETEYGEVCSVVELRQEVTERSWECRHAITDDVLRRNYAEPGVNGLLRAATAPSPYAHPSCVGHGEENGTWDLMVGVFC